jgi:hypothetical protein
MEDELAELLAGNAAPSQGNDESRWDGMTATNPQTGERIIYRISPGGRGRWVAMNSGNAPAQDREALQGDRARLTVLNRLAPLASEFNRVNRQEPTGSWWQGDSGRGFLNFLPGQRGARQNLDRMAGIESEFVRANIVPGTSGTANSVFEQELLREMTPNRAAVGPANSERMLGLHVERDLQAARVTEQERWLTRNPTLSGFAEHWQRREPQLRAELRRRYYSGSTVGDIAGRAIENATGAGGGQSQGGAPRRRYNAATGRIE